MAAEAEPLTVRKIGYRIPVQRDADGTPLWEGERMVEVAPGEWMTQEATEFQRLLAESVARFL